MKTIRQDYNAQYRQSWLDMAYRAAGKPIPTGKLRRKLEKLIKESM